ncbi:MAG: hypothetical protein IIY21_03580 [Clostridiales bacterium]|nr:hypothetical protein [Clostridiales bacterium]MBQ1570220.1 hypothetical protein [Clostridiales bacterium]
MNSRNKGKRGELMLSKKLNEYGFKTRRGQQYSGIGGEDVVGIDGVHIECKYTANGHGMLYEWVAQAVRDSDGKIPVVMHKKVSEKSRGNEWLVTMRLEDFKELLHDEIL